MKTVFVHSSDGSPEVTLVISGGLPDGDLRADSAVYDKDAKVLLDALVRSLPSGTLDRLLVHLLDATASLLRRLA